jgi:hypothetical protein
VEKKVFAWDPNAADWEDEPEVVRRFVYADWLLVLELDATDPNDVTILRKYTWGLDLAGQQGGQTSGLSPLDAAGGILDRPAAVSVERTAPRLSAVGRVVRVARGMTVRAG